jgi:CHAT domain-containing protein/tetratricopeptide (TPR) repeat protein
MEVKKHLSRFWYIYLALIVIGAKFGLAVYAQHLLIQGQQAKAGGLRHENLRHSLLAARYARVAAWPFLRKQDKGWYSVFLTRVSNGYDLVGDHTSALKWIEGAKDYAEQSQDPVRLGAVHSVYGDLLLEYDPDAASQHYLLAHKNYAVVRDLSRDPSIYLRLADCKMASRNYAGASEQLEKASAVAGRTHSILIEKANVLYHLGKYKETVDLLLSKEVSNVPIPSPDRDFLLSRSNDGLYPVLLTDSLLRLGRFQEAKTHAYGLVPTVTSEDMITIPELVGYYARAGWVHEGTGNLTQALRLYASSVAALEDYRKTIPQEFRSNLMGKEVYWIPYRRLTFMMADLPSSEATNEGLRRFGKTYFEAALYFAESGKARTFLEQLAASEKNVTGGIPEEVRKKEVELRQKQFEKEKELQRAFMKGGFKPMKIGEKEVKFAAPPEEEKRITQERIAIRKEWQKFEEDLYKRFPRYASIHYPRPVPLDQVPLKEDETILEYALGDTKSLVFLIEKGRRQIFQITQNREQIAKLVHDYLAPVRSLKGPSDPVIGRQLQESLLAAPLATISADRRIVIIPDGVLWTLPFELLPLTGEKNSGVIQDRWAFSYHASLSALALNRSLPTPRPERPFLGIGDALFQTKSASKTAQTSLRGIYIDRSRYEFPPLPETRLEVQRAAKIFQVPPQPPDVLLGEHATETEFKNLKHQSYRIIHFATHGVANNDLIDIREPALFLTTDKQNDGVLRASEVLSLRFNGPLVVLAACKTGLGEELAGEGVMSMARAFLQAGAGSVIMSLWSVPSEVTQILFERFYSEVHAGHSVGDSLNTAKMSVRQMHPDPFYWGAFVLVGEN